jgi:two-component system, LytTR family, response regulator
MKRLGHHTLEPFDRRESKPGLRTLIADDERLARQGIRMLLERDSEVGSIDEASNGKRAAELMRTRSFDLVFLDVQMPEMDGLSALRCADFGGAVIFVTAYDHYALEAFEVNAADYLLKPFTPQRFGQALQRAKARVHDGSQRVDPRVLAALEQIVNQPTYLSRIAVRGTLGTTFVDTKNIDWLEAAENYVELHVGPVRHLVQVTMKEIVKRLDPSCFVRIHRSVIVNARHLRAVQPASHSEYLLTLASGTQLRSGRTYKAAIQRLISNKM